MYEEILITQLNDFIFCPASIYFHMLYGETERKRTVRRIYDGYVFQVYAQCFALREMGYTVNKIIIHSLTDNKNYNIPLPEHDANMLERTDL